MSRQQNFPSHAPRRGNTSQHHSCYRLPASESEAAINNNAASQKAVGRSEEQVMATLREMAPEFFPE
jgi:hypothetical protein